MTVVSIYVRGKYAESIAQRMLRVIGAKIHLRMDTLSDEQVHSRWARTRSDGLSSTPIPLMARVIGLSWPLMASHGLLMASEVGRSLGPSSRWRWCARARMRSKKARMKWASRICSRASAALNEHACDACDDLSVLRALVDSVPWWLGDLSVFAVPQQVSRCDVMCVSTLSVCSAAGVLKLTACACVCVCFVKVVRGREAPCFTSFESCAPRSVGHAAVSSVRFA
jgi:hypothetical protein